MSDLIKALQIFLKYGDPRKPTHCGHGGLYVDIDPGIVSHKDMDALQSLGFSPSHDWEGFISPHFGSS